MNNYNNEMDIRSIICILTSGRLFESPYGEEKYTLLLGKWLAKQNQHVIVIGSTLTGIKTKYISKSDNDENKKDQGSKIRVLCPPYVIYMLSRLIFSLLCFMKILSLNRKMQIKLINAQDTGYAGLAAVIAGKVLKIPVIISSHGIRHKSLESNLTGKFNKMLLRFEYGLDIFTIKNADAVIAINLSIKDYYTKITAKKIEFIPIPIQLKNFEFSVMTRNLIRKELGIDDQVKIVGFIGRLSPEKNIITLIDAFAEASQDNSLIKLVLVGLGPQESLLKDEVRKHHLEDKVIFCGLRSDISQILSSFDIFVLPSYTEGLSTALLEAMTSGRAIICSNIPANQLVIEHNREGLLFDPHNTQELKDAIMLLSKDNSLCSRLGKNAKIKVREYDEDVVFPKLLHYYSTLIKKNTI